jgi:hypothetical protein
MRYEGRIKSSILLNEAVRIVTYIARLVVCRYIIIMHLLHLAFLLNVWDICELLSSYDSLQNVDFRVENTPVSTNIMYPKHTYSYSN